MKSKAKAFLLCLVLSGASVGFAAPVQAHHFDDSWPLYGLIGLIMLDSYASEHRYQSNHRDYFDHRPYYQRGNQHHHAHKKHHHHHNRRHCCRKHKHRHLDWDDDDDD